VFANLDSVSALSTLVYAAQLTMTDGFILLLIVKINLDYFIIQMRVKYLGLNLQDQSERCII
jgi:hypothetical protein